MHSFYLSETCTLSTFLNGVAASSTVIKSFFLRGQNCSSGRLLVLLRADPGVGVGNPDGQLGGPLHQSLPVLGGNSTGNLGAEGLVGHHQDFLLTLLSIPLGLLQLRFSLSYRSD